MTKQEIIVSLCAIFLLGSCKNGGKDMEYILIPGVGFNNISLGKSTSDDIIKHLGTDYSIDTFYWRPPFKKEILSIGINYVDLGITFYFAPNEKYVNSINFKAPFSGVTNKGIGLNKSTFKEIEENYGEKDWQYQSADFLHPQYVQKSYDGIVFMKKVDIEIPSDDSVLQMFINEKVDEIEINRLRN